MIDIRQGDALDRKALKAAMVAYYETIPGDVSGARSVEAAIIAYLRMIGDGRARAGVLPGQAELPL